MTTAAHSVSLRSRSPLAADAVAFRQIDRAMESTDQSTWRELAEEASAIAARLLDAGLLPGEAVVVSAADPLPYVRAMLGCFWAGAMVVPLPHGRGRRATDLLALARRLCAPRLGLREASSVMADEGSLRWLPIEGRADRVTEPLCGPDDTALLQLSSGATGTPKAAQLLHRHLAANQAAIATAFGHTPQSRILGWLPLNHDMGLIGNVLQTIHVGADCTLLPAREFSTDPLCWLRAVSRYRAHTSGGPDSAYALVAELASARPEVLANLDLSSWRCAFSGAEPIRAATLERFAASFADAGFDARAQFNCYGLAEASLLVTAGDARDAEGRLPPDGRVHCGTPPAGFQVCIVDPATRRVMPDGEDGEIWVTGPSVAQAYWSDPDATARQLHAKLSVPPRDASFLRTGDIGAMVNGRLVVQGRLDDRMTFFGRKLDARMVEEAVASALVGVDVNRIAAFPFEFASGSGVAVVVEGDPGLPRDQARDQAAAAVAARLDVPLLGVGFARAGQLPRTTSGKRRRAECARLFRAGHFASAPESQADEASHRALLGRALGRHVDASELRYDWRALGGDSLSAVRFAAALARQGIAMSAERLLSASSVADALSKPASHVAGAARAGAAAVPVWQRLLAQSQADGGAGASHVDWAAWIDGELGDLQRVIDAWVRTAAAFEPLRTAFSSTRGAMSLQLVEGVATSVRTMDVAGWSDARILADMRTRRAEPFKAGDALARLDIYRLQRTRAALHVVAHHAVCDLASLRLLTGALLAPQAPDACPSGALAALDATWRAWDEGAARPARSGELQLATDRPAPRLPDFRGADVCTQLEPATTRRLAQAAAAAGCSLVELTAALWGLVLARLSDAPDSELSLAVDLRAAQGQEALPGCGVGIVGLHLELAQPAPFVELLQAASTQLRAALAGVGHLRPTGDDGMTAGPAARLSAALRWLERADAELLGFGLSEVEACPFWAGPIAVTPIRLPVDAVQWSLELTVALVSDGGAMLQLAYSAPRFDAATARGVLHAFAAAAVALAEGGLAQDATRLPMANPATRARVKTWSRGTSSGRSPRTLLELIDAGRSAAPNQVAIIEEQPLVFEGERLPARLTYVELDDLVARLGQRLAAHGVAPGMVVGLALPRSSLLVAAMLATLRRGATFATFDPTEPAARRNAMLADIDCRLLLHAGTLVANVDALDLASPAMSDEPTSGTTEFPAPRPEAVAYAMFTSGSTGQPKAVLVPHSAIATRIQAMAEELDVRPGDIVLHKTPPTFDVSLWEIFLPLSRGLPMVVAAAGEERDADRIDALISGHGITLVHFVPSMLAAFLANRLRPCAGGVLRHVICSGEALSASLRDRALRAFADGVQLWNYYGPTEAAIDVCIHRTVAEQSCSPIGRPVADTLLRVLDRWGQPVPAAGRGELWIGGAQLARGYAGRPELTQEAFRSLDGERLYRTGDLARWTADGLLDHLGRRDDQWKLRGRRIERGEIEGVLRAMPGIADAAVVRVEGDSGDAWLEAHLAVAPGVESPSVQAILAHAARHLPAGMVPARIAVAPTLPLTTSGKIDRGRLPALPAPQASAPIDMSNAREVMLCAAMAEALDRPEIGPLDDFFELGGDSLRAIRMVARARADGLEFTVAQLYAAPCARELAGTLAEPGRQQAATLPHRLSAMRPGDSFPLSSAQAALVFLSQTDPDYEVYVTSLKLRGPFDSAKLRGAVQTIVDRHAFLRLACDPTGVPTPVQFVLPQADANIEVADWRDLPVAVRQSALDCFIEAQRRRPFDWRRAPHLRVTAHRWSDDEFRLTLADPSMDGWCVATVLTEIVETYGMLLHGDRPDPMPAPAHFRAFVELEREAESDPQVRAYWAGVLARGPAGASPRRVQPARVRRRRVLRLPASLRTRLESTAGQVGCPLRSVLLAAHAVALWRLRGRADGFVCVEMTGRLEVEGGDRDIGIYNNIVPLEVAFVGGQSWTRLAAEAAAAERAALPCRRFPHSALRAMAGGEIADAVFVQTDFRPYRRLDDGPVRLLDIEATDQTYIPLTAHFTTDPLGRDLGVLIDHDTAVHAEDAVDGYVEALHAALAALAHRPYDAVSVAEAAAIRALPPSPWNLVGAIDAQVRRAPDAIAIEQDGRQLSYRVLQWRAASVAGALHARGVPAQALVALDLPFGPDLLVGMLGCLKAGMAYVPLDTQAPRERRRAILDQARPAIVLHAGADALPGNDGHPRIALAEALCAAPVQTCTPIVGGMAYVLFTSGSTGTPKGVAVGIDALSAYVRWAAGTYALQRGRGAAVMTGPDVDMSITPLLCPLVAGRRVTFAPHVGDIEALRRFAGDPDLGVLKLAPAHLDALAAAAALPLPSRWPAETILGGEDIAPRHLAILDGAACSVVNEYGPTETTVGCLAAWLPPPPRPPGCVHLGDPTSGARVRLVDALGGNPPTDVPGEIVISGPQVALGYLHEPGRTAAAFRPAADGAREYLSGDHAVRDRRGVLRYLGRIDRQAKIRGRRVELGDIEAQLMMQPGVSAALCVPVRSDDGRDWLGACVAARPGATLLADQLRNALKASLPAGLVPARIVVVDGIPLTPAGKTDLRSLERLLQAAPESDWFTPLLREVHAMTDAEALAALRHLGRPAVEAME